MSADSTGLTYLITGLQFGGANIRMVRVLSQLPSEEFDVSGASFLKTQRWKSSANAKRDGAAQEFSAELPVKGFSHAISQTRNNRRAESARVKNQ